MSRATNLAGFSTSISPPSNLNVGVVTATSFVGSGANLTGVVNINSSGISTLGTLKISSGIVTAVSGIVTYYGDGSNLTGVAAAGSGGANDITSNLFF